MATAADAAVISSEDPNTAWCKLSALKKAVHNNFMPAFFMLGAAAMAMHYEAVLGKYGLCPAPVAIGEKKHGKVHRSERRCCQSGKDGKCRRYTCANMGVSCKSCRPGEKGD